MGATAEWDELLLSLEIESPIGSPLWHLACPWHHTESGGKPVDPKITVVYEGRSYAFAEEACRTKWREAREHSLYHQLGGRAAIDAAVEAFYVKVLADKRINQYFEDINMTKQRRKQKEFLSAAFGGPIP